MIKPVWADMRAKGLLYCGHIAAGPFPGWRRQS